VCASGWAPSVSDPPAPGMERAPRTTCCGEIGLVQSLGGVRGGLARNVGEEVEGSGGKVREVECQCY
jgi:hypothetical protein